MKARYSFLLVTLAAAVFVLNVWITRDRLPERVASHFDLQGRPDGWMTREGTVRFMAAVGVGVPLIIMAAFNLARVVPLSCIHVPNKDYWFAKERREESLRWLGATGAWCAILLLIFLRLLHGLVIEANTVHPPHLPSKPLWIVAGIFVVGELLLVLRVMWRFSKRPAN
jgi:hypothetical protein